MGPRIEAKWMVPAPLLPEVPERVDVSAVDEKKPKVSILPTVPR